MGVTEYVRVCRIHHLPLQEPDRRRNDVLVCPFPERPHPAVRLVQDRISRPPVVKASYEIWLCVDGHLRSLYAKVEGGHVEHVADTPDKQLHGRDEKGMTNDPERQDKRRRYSALAAALGILAGAGAADARAGGLHSGAGIVRAEMAVQVVMAGEADTKARPAGFVEADVPIGWGQETEPGRAKREPFLRGHLGLNLAGRPGASDFGFARVQTFQTVDLRLGATRLFGSSGGYAWGLTAEWGIGARLTENGERPADRLVQRGGGGLKLYHRKTGAGVTVIYGRDGAVGPTLGNGQMMVAAHVIVPSTEQIVALRVQASTDIRVGQPEAFKVGRASYYSVAASIDAAKLLGRLSKKAPAPAPRGATMVACR